MTTRPRPRRLALSRLEDRLAPAATNYASLINRPYTTTEILADFGQSSNPAAAFRSLVQSGRLAGFDLASTHNLGGELLQIGLAPGTSPLAALATVADLPGVSWVSPNYVYRAVADIYPNDPLYASGQQTYLAQTGVPAAWATLLGASSPFPIGSSSTVVAVIDDGVSFSHPDIGGSIWTNQLDTPDQKDNDNNTYIDDYHGWDFVGGTSDPQPIGGQTHGTLVAGVIAAAGNNGTGIVGIAGGDGSATPAGGVQIMPLRVVSTPSISDSNDAPDATLTAANLAAAIYYAADHGVRVVNISLNLDDMASDAAKLPIVTGALNYAYGKNVLIVASAGNNGAGTAARSVFDQVLFVGSVNASGQRSSFSNYGSYVDLAAPGENIVSTWTEVVGALHTSAYTDGVSKNSKGTVLLPVSGTSFSSPQVAGLAGLLIAEHPTWSRDQVVARLVATATASTAQLGSGVINAALAVSTTTATPPPTFSNTTLPAEGSTVTTLDSFQLFSRQRFDPASVVAGSFALIGDGLDNAPGGGDDITIPLTVSAYKIGSNAITLTPADRLRPDQYRFTAKSGSGFLTDPFGTSLDGNGDGFTDDSFVRNFTVISPAFQTPAVLANTVSAAQVNDLPDTVSTAVAADGSSVAVWAVAPFGPVYARRFDRFGTPLGAEFVVSQVATNPTRPAVAVDGSGNFTVVWQATGVNASGQGDASVNIQMRRYSAAGVPLGNETLVNSFATGSQVSPVITIDPAGDTVVVWQSPQDADSSYGVYFQRYTPAGTKAGSETRANSYTTGQQYAATVGSDSIGNFVIAWTSDGQDGSNGGIYAQRYTASGATVNGEALVNTTTTGNQIYPSLTMRPTGEYTVVWQTPTAQSINGKRFAADGSSVSGEFTVNSLSTSIVSGPSTTTDAAGNTFVVWSQLNADFTTSVFGRWYGSEGGARGSAFALSNAANGSNTYAGVASNASGDTVVGWRDSQLLGVRLKRTSRTAQVASVRPLNDTNAIASGERVTQPLTGFAVAFTVPPASTSLANWKLTRNGLDITSQIINISYSTNTTTGVVEALATLAAPLRDGSIVLTLRDTLLDPNGNKLDGNADNLPGGDYTLAFTLQPVTLRGPEVSVAAGFTRDQTAPRVAIDAAGNSVAVWASTGLTQGLPTLGIFAQRYGPNGELIGNEFRVSTSTTTTKQFPTVAMAADGGFLVAWQSILQDGDGTGIYAQRYAADGTAAGGEFRVNTYTTSQQTAPSATALADGSYVVTWASNGQDGSNYGIYAQRYTSAGVAAGGEFRVNTYTTDSQRAPAVAGLADGGFVVTWSSNLQDLSSDGIYAQRYTAGGATLGSEFRVNTTFTGPQQTPTIAASSGGFVIAWGGAGPGDTGFGIFAQRYTTFGSPVGGEFRVNNYTTNTQIYPAVAIDANSDVAVVWADYGQEGSGAGVYLRRFDTSGTAVAGDERVNTTTSGNQKVPAIAATGDGRFVVAWQSAGLNGYTNGVAVQRYASIAEVLPTAGEVRVNTYTTSTQAVHDATELGDGSYVVVWSSSGQDGSGFGVFGQRYAATGATIGGEFRANTYTTNNQVGPSVAALADGGFVIVWTSDLQDTGTSGIYAQRYAASGAASGVEFRVNTAIPFTQNTARVAGLSDGGFEVVWQSISQEGNDYGVYSQRYTAAGTATGGEVHVNTYTTNDQFRPAVAGLRDGGYVIAWESSGQDGQFDGIYAQRYTATGGLASVEFRINSYTTSSQSFPSLAALADGGFAAIWQSYNQDGSGYGIYGQRYSAAGGAVGGEFQANTFTTGTQQQQTVAALADGGFAVGWASDNQDGSGTGVYAQRYTAAGVTTGGEIRLNITTSGNQAGPVALAGLSDGSLVAAWTSTSQDGDGDGVYSRVVNWTASPRAASEEVRANASTTSDQSQTHTAALTDGTYITVWTSNGQDGSGTGVYARRYDRNGAPLTGEFNVNGGTTNQQQAPAVTAMSDGGYVIAWEDGRSSNLDVYWRRFSAINLSSGEFRANTYTTGNQSAPSVAALADGGFAITWTSVSQDGDQGGIYGQRFSNTSTAVGIEFRVNTTTAGQQAGAAVAGLVGGGFTVVWQSYNQDNAGDYGVYGQRYSAAGAATGSEFLVNTTVSGRQFGPTITSLVDGGFAVAWSSLFQDSSGYGIYAQRYDGAGVQATSEFRVNTTTAGSQYRPALTSLADGGFAVVWDSAGQDGSGTGLYVQRYTANSVANGGEVAVTSYTTGDQFAGAVAGLSDGGFATVWDSTGQDGDQGGVYTRVIGQPALQRPAGGEVRVNTYTTGNQNSAKVASLADGSSVAVWYGTGVGDTYGVYAQRYDAAGTVAGSEFRVNTYTVDSQFSPSVVGLVSGGFVVTWQSNGQDNSGYGVYAQRYDTAGKALGSEFRVNTYTTNSQRSPSVAALASGGFLVVWRSDGQDNSFDGVYAQRYDSAGTVMGSEFRVNTYTTNFQSFPTAAGLASGGFIVAWQSYGQDISGYGIYAQRYDSAGASNGSEFRINSTTTNDQYYPSVAALAGGGFAVVWASNGQDGSGYGVYAQRYDTGGVVSGSEFRVNTTTANNQYYPAVAAMTGGGFTVAWQSSLQDGSAYGVYAQRYDGTGATAGSEFRVNSYTTSYQYYPAVAGLMDGSFAVVWRSRDQDGSSDGVYMQRYSPPTSQQPIGGETPVNTYTTNYQSSPVSAGLNDGGYVTVWTGEGASDTSGIYAQRYTASGIATGSEFRVNFTTVGTQLDPGIAALADGGFVVTWSSAGQDGSGYGVYAQRYARDGSSVGSEFRANTYTTGSQNQASVSGLADGGFVIAWASATQEAGNSGVYAQRYAVNGALVGGEFHVNTTTTSVQEAPSVAGLSGGGYAIAWTSYGQDAKNGTGVYANVYTANDTLTLIENRVNTYTTSDQVGPKVAGLADGGFAVAWSSNAQDGSGYGVYAQRYTATAPAGTEFRVNIATTTNQIVQGIAGLSDGGFVIAWESDAQSLNFATDAYARRYGPAGATTSGEFVVSTTVLNSQYHPTVAALADGGYVAAWSSQSGVGAYDIYTQRYTGSPRLGAETPVNNPSTPPSTAKVAIDANGDTVAVWASNSFGANGTDILARRYSPNGSALGNAFVVNSFTTGSQRAPAVAMATDGSFVVTWQSENQDGSGWGVYGQMFAAGGGYVGSEFRVNAATAGDQTAPAIALDASGAFTIVYASGPANSILGRSYSATGNSIGGEFLINSTTRVSTNPSLAVNASGDYVVSWESSFIDGSGLGVLARRFNAGNFPVGPQFTVNTTTTGNQFNSSAGIDAAGNFVIAWQSDNGQDGSGTGIYARRYNGVGAALGGEFLINSTTTGEQTTPVVAVDRDGDTLIAWTSADASGTGIFYQRLNANGVAVGDETRANTKLPNNQTSPAVALTPTGDGVFAWIGGTSTDLGTSVGYGSSVSVQRLGSDDAPLPVLPTLTFGINEDSAYNSDLVSLFTDANEPYPTLTYAVQTLSTSNGLSFVTSLVGSLLTITPTANSNGTALLLITATDSSGLSSSVSATFVVNAINDAPTFSINPLRVNLTNQTNSTVTFNYADFITASSVGAANESTQSLTYEIVTNSNPGLFSVLPSIDPVAGALTYKLADKAYGAATLTVRLRDSGGTANGGIDVSPLQVFTITSETSDLRTSRQFNGKGTLANTTLGATQAGAQMAVAPGGAYLVVWQGTGPGDSDGIFGQRYAANGLAQSGEFLVNTLTTGAQTAPSVAVDANGNFVVVWQSLPAAQQYNVIARRFDANGGPLTSDINLGADSLAQNSAPSVASDAAGNFAVAWQAGPRTGTTTLNPDGDGQAIFARRFGPDGTPLTAAVQVNARTTGDQTAPSIASDAVGNFVVTWQDSNRPGDTGLAVVARQFDASASARGGEIAVNTLTTGDQSLPRVAMDAAGNFAVAWQSDVQDGTGNVGISLRRYSASGSASTTTEARVNTFTTGQQLAPTLAIDADGDLAVAWVSVNQAGATSARDIYLQRYDRTGAITGSETLANTYSTGAQDAPSIALDADGDLVIAWSGTGSETATGIYARRFGIPAPATTGIPQQVTTGTSGSISLSGFVQNPNNPGEALPASITGWTNPELLVSVLVNVATQIDWTFTGGGEFGSSRVDIRVTDSTERLTEDAFIVRRLQDPSKSPVLDIIGNRFATEGTPLTFTATAVDPQGPSGLVYSLLAGPAGASVDSITGVFSWTPTDSSTTPFTVKLRVTDPGGLYTQETFRVTVANAKPTATLTGPAAVTLNSAAKFTLSGATDASSVDAASLRYAFDFDNNGTWDVGNGSYAGSVAAATATTPASFFSTLGSRTVKGRVIDKDGGFTDYYLGVPVVAPPVATFSVNDGSAQRSSVSSLTVTFSSVVTLPTNVATAFALSKLGGTDVGGFTATASTASGVTVVTLTGFTGANTAVGSLATGAYRLTIHGSLISANGQLLDGDGDGLAGGDQVVNGTAVNGLYRLYGDSDGNGSVDAQDVTAFLNTYGASQGNASFRSYLDADGNGSVDAQDVTAFLNTYGTSIP